ncbi:hypothetical protein DXG03_005681 [Asterophora parasitica]|uniref:Uncharacterized protein n=1 Tax=Asterophora parasitica TaxID=117018 RepID=A0A9P7FZ74_9AGAR|nr:hypothetical protein DXG03_005681 [Asterophora parasitica]
MTPSGYTPLDLPLKPTKGSRRRAQHLSLSLPLVERHSYYASDDLEENLLTAASSRWVISATPKSSASMYSQASYSLSPPIFSETKLDRRRFGISMTPTEPGPWHHPLQSAGASNVFAVDLRSATVLENPFMGNEDDVEEASAQEEVLRGVEKKEGMLEQMEPQATTNGNVASQESTNAKLKKLRTSSRIIGKMLSRLPVHRSNSSRSTSDVEQPLLSELPPRILISLPSPGLEIPSGSSQDASTFSTPRNRATLPSKWKPHRPPSPLPNSLRKHGKHKRNASDLSYLIASPPPPLPTPTRALILSRLAPPVPKRNDLPYLSFSTPLSSSTDVPSSGQESSRWAEIQLRLKARALKSSTYAIHDGGIISPTTSA